MSIRYFRLWIAVMMLFGAIPAQAAVTTYCCDAAAQFAAKATPARIVNQASMTRL